MPPQSTLRVGLFILTIQIATWACGPTGSVPEEQAPSPTATADEMPTEGEMPTFQVEPMWPKPLPNAWTLGWVAGLFVDSQDHLWMLQVPGSLSQWEDGANYDPPRTLCCRAAPPVIEFDQAGNIVQTWGGPGPGYDWPSTEHGLFIDHDDNVWISSSANDEGQVLKFTRDGQFLLQIGQSTSSNGSNDTSSLGGPAGIAVDEESNEVFIADGYGNRRVIVFDADTGEYKRHWGAYGETPDDAPFEYDPDLPLPRQFNSVHCLALSDDNLLYVCDRGNNRVQVFQTDGTFVTEGQIMPRTQGSAGTSDGLGFSPDADQRFLYVADGGNHRVWILDRNDLNVIGSFGHGGHGAGGFIAPHTLGVDSEGNVYVGESVDGRRVQRFAYTGMGGASGAP